MHWINQILAEKFTRQVHIIKHMLPSILSYGLWQSSLRAIIDMLILTFKHFKSEKNSCLLTVATVGWFPCTNMCYLSYFANVILIISGFQRSHIEVKSQVTVWILNILCYKILKQNFIFWNVFEEILRLHILYRKSYICKAFLVP